MCKQTGNGLGLSIFCSKPLGHFGHLIFSILFLVLISQNSSAAESGVIDQDLIQLSHDQPMYFLVGAPEVKAQISFKAKIFTHTDFYVAYTQKVFWDLFKKSSPFRDVDYNPSLFYRIHLDDPSEAIIDLVGYEHESNGMGDRTTRSWDRFGVKFQKSFFFKNDVKLTWNTHAWVPFNFDAENSNLTQYRGLYEWILQFQ